MRIFSIRPRLSRAFWRRGEREAKSSSACNRPASARAPRSALSRLFYRLFRLISETTIPEGATDFVLLDRQSVNAVNALNSVGERCRFSKELYFWIGFRSKSVLFTVEKRKSENSRWKLPTLGRYALDGFASFSSLPLKMWSYLGLAVSASAISYALYFAIEMLIFGGDVPGFPSLIVSITFFAGVQLISLGVIGEYLSRVFEEVKARPLYVIAETIGRSEVASRGPVDSAE
jgi:polyisoprenyl-phosphate glycosyltransferase